MANSRDVTTDSGGGSGGSILIFTNAFSGSHTGAIQVIGGSGNAGTGGGSGGRLAVYYNNMHTDHPYRGSLDVYGGNVYREGRVICANQLEVYYPNNIVWHVSAVV